MFHISLLLISFAVSSFAHPAILGNGEEIIENPDVFMYNPGMLGGDIAGGYDIVSRDAANNFTAIKPNSAYGYWPNAIIYYEFHSSLTSTDRTVILNAINEYHINTCIRFVNRNGNTAIKNYILIRGDYSGCWSYVGRYAYGYQEVSLQRNGCMYKGTVMHELMHAAGFFHEHQRYDRASYISVVYSNIITGYESNFDIVTLTDSVNVGGATYDFGSIMHYELTAFSKNGAKTMQPIGQWVNVDPGYVWNQNYFSAGDIKQLKAVYCSVEL